MANPDPASLDRLNGFVQPEPVGFWPLAPVWKFVIALVLAWLIAWIANWIARYARNAYRREAIAKLDEIEIDGDLVRLNELLKRTAMTAYGRDAVASLHGARWIEFLGGVCAWVDPTVDVLADVSSQTVPVALSDHERKQLFRFARDWIRHHVVETPSC